MTNQEGNSKAYHRVKNVLFLVGLILDFSILLVIFLSGFSASIKEFACQISSNTFIINAVYFLIFSSVMYALHFPLSIFSGFTWEHKFKLSNQSFFQWLRDDFKKALLGFTVSLVAVEVIYFLLGRFPENWWIAAVFFWLLLTIVIAQLTPNVIIPLFYKYSSIENQILRERILVLFRNCQVPLKNVYAINLSSKTKKANAFFCGLGHNRRVVLSDTLVSNFTVEEIEAVVAHELGHLKHRDILKMIFVNSLISIVGFYFLDIFLKGSLYYFGLKGINDITFFPILILSFVCFGLITTPLLNAYSRRIEVQADRFCLQTTRNPDHFISMMRKLGEMNLAEFKPNRFIEIFFYDHPPLEKRIQLAKNIKLA